MKYNFNIEKNEVLRYLGYKGQEISLSLEERINECRKLILEKAQYRYVKKIYNIKNHENGVEVVDTTLFLEGEHIKKHLEHSKKILLMSVTLGNEVDKIIKLKERISMEEALILDACATTLIEELCDAVEKEFSEEIKKEKKFITFRYSPGYGDLPISTQRDFIRVMDAQRQIGLTATSNNILIPRKSVTAIIGINDINIEKEKRGCEGCLNYKNCSFRREGVSCGD